MALKELDVFLNVPFDGQYRPIFHAMIFAIVRYGYRVRCALEIDDSSQNRFAKICSIVRECKFGVHDISRTESGGDPPLPRFNMPLELGLFLGAKQFGGAGQKRKTCVILDRDKHRYQKFISDLAGQDIHNHGGIPKTAVKELTGWMRAQPGGVMPGGGDAVWREYRSFQRGTLKSMCEADRIKISELSFIDFNNAVALHIAKL